MILQQLLACLIAAAAPTFAGAIPHAQLIERQADSGCVNGPLTRGCWAGGFSISTDYEAKYPNTGVVVEGRLNLVGETLH